MRSALNRRINKDSWYEMESTLLYDYMVRMTGKMDEMASSLVEVITAIRDQEKEEDSEKTLQEVRVNLYLTAKRFCADSWGKYPDAALDQVYHGTNQHDVLRKVEDFLKDQSVDVREFLLLKDRYKFSDEDIREILSPNNGAFEKQVEASYKSFDETFPDLERKAFIQLPLFSIENNYEITAALSAVLELPKSKMKRRLVSLAWVLAIVTLIYLGLRFS